MIKAKYFLLHFYLATTLGFRTISCVRESW